MNSNWYFVRLFRRSKLLFALVILFFALHINANFFFGGQQSPFFQWNLYAEPVNYQHSYSFWEIAYNDGQILKIPHTWQQPGSLLILNPLTDYMYRREHGFGMTDQYITNWNSNHPSIARLFPNLKFFPDSVEMKGFPAWFIRKLEQYTNQPVTEATIFKTEVTFNKNGKVELLSRVPVCKLK